MKIVYLDTETTDLEPGQICQLSYLVEVDGTLVKRVNQYFTVQSINPEAAKVNKLTLELLAGLSEGRVFSDRAVEFYNDINGGILAGHNIDFDIKHVSAEFARLGLGLEVGGRICTMKYFTNIMKIPGKNGGYKYPNLGKTCEFVGLNQDMIAYYTNNVYGECGIGSHDSRYDVMAVYMIVKSLENKYGTKITDIIRV